MGETRWSRGHSFAAAGKRAGRRGCQAVSVAQSCRFDELSTGDGVAFKNARRSFSISDGVEGAFSIMVLPRQLLINSTATANVFDAYIGETLSLVFVLT